MSSPSGIPDGLVACITVGLMVLFLAIALFYEDRERKK